MSDDTQWRDLLVSLVRRSGAALVDHLEQELRAQLIEQLGRPEIKKRQKAIRHVREILRQEVPRLPNSAKTALEPFLRRTLELADSESFIHELTCTLDMYEFSVLERLVLFNRLAPDSLIEIQLFEGSQDTPERPGLRLLTKSNEPPAELS